MANPQLFDTLLAKLPKTTAVNREFAPAYAYTPQHQLAQLAMTGCLNQTFYADAQAQLADVLALTEQVDAEFIARTAVYCRERGLMKDMPALLTAILAARGSEQLARVFGRTINNGKMLRNFVQILRSGATGRKSLGSRPKKLVQTWLNTATEQQLLQACVGTMPSLADVVKMVHPKPAEAWREAFFAWLIGKAFDAEKLPPLTRELLAFRAGQTTAVPDVPFQLLGNERLTAEQWLALAEKMGWHSLRMNLNVLTRQGTLALPGAAAMIARRLADPVLVKKSRAYPYQLMAAYRMTGNDVPAVVREALQSALNIALANVPKLEGKVVVCPDVSGSMRSAITGVRKGATTTVRCVDVAALIAAAILRTHPDARVLPFENEVVEIRINPRDSVLTNAEKLAAVGGGGTNCSAPLKLLARERARVDMVIIVSDNQSWIDATHFGKAAGNAAGSTATMAMWEKLKRNNPEAKLVCIDLQPYGTSQAIEREDILNVGGFGDAVFDVLAQYAAGGFGAGHWLEAINAVQL